MAGIIAILMTVGGAFAQAEKPVSTPVPTVDPTIAANIAAWDKTLAELAVVETPADFAAVVSSVPGNPHERTQQAWRFMQPALKVGAPDALNLALALYGNARVNESTEQGAIANVAAALKNKDGNLTRANQWIAQQTTGTDKVVFTPDELKIPDWLAEVFPPPAEQLRRAQAQFRAAGTDATINAAVEAVAKGLRAVDRDLVRSHAFIEAMREGKSFPITD